MPPPFAVVRGATIAERRAYAIDWAVRWAKLCLRQRRPCAAVVDIDATLLDARGVKIDEVVDGVRRLHRLGVHIAIITARSSEGEEYTKDQLLKAKIPFDALYLHPATAPLTSHEDAARQKAEWRAEVNLTFTEIVNIGNAPGDHTVDDLYCPPKDVCIYLDKAGVAHVKLPELPEREQA
jgi:hypothetical protein